MIKCSYRFTSSYRLLRMKVYVATTLLVTCKIVLPQIMWHAGSTLSCMGYETVHDMGGVVGNISMEDI